MNRTASPSRDRHHDRNDLREKQLLEVLSLPGDLEDLIESFRRSNRSKDARTMTAAGQRSTNRSSIAVGNILVVSTEACKILCGDVLYHILNTLKEVGGCNPPFGKALRMVGCTHPTELGRPDENRPARFQSRSTAFDRPQAAPPSTSAARPTRILQPLNRSVSFRVFRG